MILLSHLPCSEKTRPASVTAFTPHMIIKRTSSKAASHQPPAEGDLSSYTLVKNRFRQPSFPSWPVLCHCDTAPRQQQHSTLVRCVKALIAFQERPQLNSICRASRPQHRATDRMRGRSSQPVARAQSSEGGSHNQEANQSINVAPSPRI